MKLSNLPRIARAVYLGVQMAVVFAVMMTTDMASSIWRWRYDPSRYITCKVFIHLFSMLTILRCFYLIAKLYIPKDASLDRPHGTLTTRCPFKRAMRYTGALLGELFMILVWIVVICLAFEIRNEAAGFVSVAVLFLHIFRAFIDLCHIIQRHADKSAASSVVVPSSSSSESGSDRGNYRSVGPMFMPQYRDSDAADAEKGYPSDAKPLGHGASTDTQAVEQERLPRASEDTVGAFEGESSTLLK